MPTLRLGNIAPDFEAETTKGPIKFHEWIGDSWVCLRSSSSRLSLLISARILRLSCSPTRVTSRQFARLSLQKWPGGESPRISETEV